MTSANLSIAAVERETRLSKDTLRAWEKRYGFPTPKRDANGERCYPVEQVERLHLMRRLLDQGLRPGRLARLSLAELTGLAQRPATHAALHAGLEEETLAALLDTLKRDPAGLQSAMQQQLARAGLERFVTQLVAPLTARVGAGWEDGTLDIFDEHFYTETTLRILRQAIGALPPGVQARVLLTTLPGESHGLGLVMAEALLALDGATCIALGTQTPPSSIARAACTHAADVVALSFSAAYPRRQIGPALQQLRQLLPPAVALWAGGASAADVAAIEGVALLPTLDDGRRALAAGRFPKLPS